MSVEPGYEDGYATGFDAGVIVGYGRCQRRRQVVSEHEWRAGALIGTVFGAALVGVVWLLVGSS